MVVSLTPIWQREEQRLLALLEVAGLRRVDVHLDNILTESFPRGQKKPYKKELDAARPRISLLIEQFKPDLVIPLGAEACQFFLPYCSLSKDHGMIEQGESYSVMPMYSPAASMHNPSLAVAMKYDFDRLGRHIRGEKAEVIEVNYSLARSEDAAVTAWGSSTIGFDLETTSPMRRKWFAAEQAEIVGYSLSSQPLVALYVPELPLDPQVVAALESPQVTVIAHNSKFEYARMLQLGVTMTNFRCTKIEAYLLQYPDTSLKTLTRQVLGINPITYADVTQGRDMSDIPPAEVAPYAAADADNARRLDERFMPQLESNGLIPLFRDVEMPLVPVIADMELNGQLVDVVQTEKIYAEHESHREQVSVALHSLGLEVDNLNSTEQVALSLESLGAPLQERTPSKGHFVVDDGKLLSIRDWNPGLIDSLLDYRRSGKRQSYLRNFLELRGTDGRLHPSVQQCGGYEEGKAKGGEAPATGRISYSGPSLQQIPNRGDPAIISAMRSCLIAEPGKVLLCCDASQEEPRILSYVADDKQMQADFDSGNPIYAFIGKELYGHNINKLDHPQEWFVSKTFFLAWVYGADFTKLLEIDRSFGTGDLTLAAARTGARRLHQRYPAVDTYREDVLEQARHSYRLRDCLGRLRNFNKMGSGFPEDRQAAMREAFNFTIQGPAATIMKVVLRRVWDKMPSSCKVWLTVHDEIILELDPDDVDEVATLCYDSFQGIIPIPLPVGFSVGTTWGNVEPYYVPSFAA